MTLATLFTDEAGWLGADRLVFGADEVAELADCVAQAAHLSRLVTSREAELERAREEARAEARLEGLAEGRREAAAALGEALARLDDDAAEASRRARDGATDLALAVVRRIAAGVAPEERLVALAREAARELVEEPRRRLRVHPSCRAAVAARLEAGGPHGLDEIVDDDALEADEAFIDTGRGSVAIDLDTQLQEIARLLAASPDASSSGASEPSEPSGPSGTDALAGDAP